MTKPNVNRKFFIVHFPLEHNAPNMVKGHDPIKRACIIHYGETVPAGGRNHLDKIAQARVGTDRQEIRFDKVGRVHHRQDGVVFVMSDKLFTRCKLPCINGMGLEIINSKI